MWEAYASFRPYHVSNIKFSKENGNLFLTDLTSLSNQSQTCFLYQDTCSLKLSFRSIVFEEFELGDFDL